MKDREEYEVEFRGNAFNRLREYEDEESYEKFTSRNSDHARRESKKKVKGERRKRNERRNMKWGF